MHGIKPPSLEPSEEMQGQWQWQYVVIMHIDCVMTYVNMIFLTLLHIAHIHVTEGLT